MTAMAAAGAPSEQPPFPPVDLASLACNLDREGDPIERYERLGAEAKAAILSLLGSDWSFEGKRVLDFGCGAGRTLRHFVAEAEGAEIWGADINDACVSWLQERLCPPLHAVHSSVDPPFDAGSGSFDLVWALSVFTHLTENSLPWLLELHRLIKPGGLLIATYMGRWNSQVLDGEPWEEDKIGMNVLRPAQGWEFGGPSVLMSDWWVHAHWGRAFEIVEIEPQIHGQSWALMRKREVEVTVEDLQVPEDDPRELIAIRNNVRQLQREQHQMKRIYEHRIAQAEGTLGWRAENLARRALKRARALGRGGSS